MRNLVKKVLRPKSSEGLLQTPIPPGTHTHKHKNPPTPANSSKSASEEKCRLRGKTTRGVFRRATFLEGSRSISKSNVPQWHPATRCPLKLSVPWCVAVAGRGFGRWCQWLESSLSVFQTSENNVCPALAS